MALEQATSVIEKADIDRLMAETLAIFEASSHDNPVLEWAEKHDIDEELLAMLATKLTNMATSIDMEDFEQATTDPTFVLERIASSCVMAFLIGWLSHEQYGTKTT